MKKFATLVLVAVFGALLVAPIEAQQPGPRGGQGQAQRQRPGGMMLGQRLQQVEQKVLDQLNLNANQKKQIDELNKTTRAKTEAIFKKYGVTPPQPGQRAGGAAQGGQRPGGAASGGEQGRRAWGNIDPKMMEELRAVQQDRQDGMRKILTKEQQEKYRQLMQEERAKMRGNRPGGAPGAPGGGGKPGGGKSGG